MAPLRYGGQRNVQARVQRGRWTIGGIVIFAIVKRGVDLEAVAIS